MTTASEYELLPRWSSQHRRYNPNPFTGMTLVEDSFAPQQCRGQDNLVPSLDRFNFVADIG